MAEKICRHLPYDNEICTKLIGATAYNLKKFRLEKKMTQMLEKKIPIILDNYFKNKK